MRYQKDFIEKAKSLLSYDPETGVFRWLVNRQGKAKAGDVAGSTRNDGYCTICVARVKLYQHQLAWMFVHGAAPLQTIDHRNGNPSDNRIGNLRDVSSKKNSENRTTAGPRKNCGRLLGAHWSKIHKRWKSSIATAGKSKHLGWFDSEKDAHAAYVKAKRELHEGCTI